MSDCVGCCFKHYGRLRPISILRYYYKMSRNRVLLDFYQDGVDNHYFANADREEYASLMANGRYVKAFLKRVKKRY